MLLNDGPTPAQSCEHGACEAVPLGNGRCLAHASPEEVRAAAKRCRAGQPLDARGIRITGAVVRQFLRAALGADAWSDTAVFDPDRPGASLRGPVYFDGATFLDSVDFRGVTFGATASFDNATFCEGACFDSATFAGHADFDAANFKESPSFWRTTFRDHAGFAATTFVGGAYFAGATFESNTDFVDAEFLGDADFHGVTLELTRKFGPLTVEGRLELAESVVGKRAQLIVTACELSAQTTTFADGVHLRVAGADVDLEHADFVRPSSLSGLPGQHQPRLMTLWGAHVSHLTLSNVDLRPCRFSGSHGLESLNIEPSCRWEEVRPAFRRPRRALTEELEWRASQRRGRWVRHRRPAADGGRSGPALEPAELASIYRGLRQAREDHKDQPGAGDLYYGEMEMRRVSASGSRGAARGRLGDRAVLALYWLVSGYGLKASRAAVILLAVVVGAALVLDRWGFTPDACFSAAMFASLESTSSLLRSPSTGDLQPTEVGHAVELALRAIGPLLIGLALLAVRARVKR